MKILELDKPTRYLYLATIAILFTGLCFSVLGPLLTAPETRQVSTEPAATHSPAASDPVLQFTQERAQIREKEQAELKAIMEDKGAEASLKYDATQRLMQLLAWIEQEITIEGVLRIRGFMDPVVTVHQDSANVMVRAESLTRQQSAQVLDLVSRETGLTGGNIKIIPIN